MNYTCQACGHRSRSAIAEARHRHNFPAMCKRNARFARWSKHYNIKAMQEKLDALPRGAVFVVVWVPSGTDHICRAIYRKICEGPDVECLMDSIGSLPSPPIYHTIGKHFLENKLRVEVLDPAKLDAFDMLWMHGRYAKASELAGGPEVV